MKVIVDEIELSPTGQPKDDRARRETRAVTKAISEVVDPQEEDFGDDDIPF